MTVSNLISDRRPSISSQRAIAVFDSRVDDLDVLLAGLLPDIEAVVLHPHQDGVAQLSALLSQRNDIKQLHLIAHGQPGCLFLGSGTVDAAALATVDWQRAFATDAQIAVYGCEAAAGDVGQVLLSALHRVTGAAVAGSQAPVGRGNWTLESTVGAAEPVLAFSQRLYCAYRKQFMLTFVEFDKDGQDDGSGNTIDGLDQASSVAISPDGKFLYAASQTDNAVATFSRNPATGALTFVEVDIDGQDDGSGNTIDGFGAAIDVTISPDGSFLYATGFSDNAVATFSRNSTTGALTFVEVDKNGQDDGSGNTINGLNGANGVTISPDGNFLYGVGRNNAAVATFSRNPTTGALTFVEVDIDGGDDGSGNTIDGLASPRQISISPDGNFLYAVGFNDNAVATFSRNSTTGALTFVEVDRDGGDDGSGNTIDGLGGAFDVTISPDGNSLYAVGFNDNAVATFSRNSTTGALTFVEVDRDGGDDGSGNTIDGLDGARFLTTSPDGSFLYVAGQFDDAVATFDTGVTQVAFSAANFTITENSGTSTAVTVTRTGGPTGLAGTSSVVVNVTGGTATPGTDFDNGSFPFTVNFAANATSQTVSIPITDDTLVETGGETITFSLATPTGTSIGTQNTTTLTITDNDSPTPAPTPAAAPIAPPPSGPIRPLVPEATTTPAPDPVPTATAPTVSLPALPGTAIGGTETEGDTLTGSDASEAILGFAGEDTLTGKSGSDFLFGWTGNDLIDGGGGDDFARGGGGDDTLYGDRGGRDATGLGSDTLDGGDGNDVIFGDAEILTETGGDDLLIGGNGNDRLFGQKGDDTLTGNNGADTLNGGVGNDVIFGGDGNDLIDGDIGNDILIGNDGADTFRVGEGSDTIQDFIAGTDVIDLPDGVSFSDLIITTTGTGTQFTATGFLSVTLDNFLGTLRAANFI